MNNKYFLMIILFALFCALISCKKSGQNEKEPNDDFYTANKVEPDAIFEGLLNTPIDQDFYRLDLVSPIVMDIELTPVKGINHAIKIWKYNDTGQTPLKYIDDARKSSSERICNMFFDIGTYYIEVLHGDRDSPQGNSRDYYQLRLSSGDFDEEEKENNDNYDNANFFEIGREIKGYFSPAFNKLNQSTDSSFREEDWFYFDIDLADEQPILLDINLSGVPDVNSVLSLLNGERNEIASSDSGGTGEGERLEGIGIKKSGKYYITITSHFESNNDIPYRLQAISRISDFNSEIEPNNNFENANLITQNEITAKISPEGDNDYYLFNTQIINGFNTDSNIITNEKYLYRIEASSESLDLVLRIIDENKNELFEIDNVKGPGKELMPDALIKDNFYIIISSKHSEVTSKEYISKNSDSEYKFNVSYFPYSEYYEKEPNDTKETATRIKSGKIIGFISKKDDRDYYLLEYKNRVRKKITLHGIIESELKISITDPLGFIIRTESINGRDSISFSEMIDLKGYLIVESVAANYDEPYTIELGE